VFTYGQELRGAEHYLTVRDNLAQQGYHRLWLNGQMMTIDKVAPSMVESQTRLDVVIDRVALTKGADARVDEALSRALELGEGAAEFHFLGHDEQSVALREGAVCPICARLLPRAQPGLFSHDSPVG